MGIPSVLSQLFSARPPRQYVSLYEEANGWHVHDELWWVWNWLWNKLWNKLWNWLWNYHDVVPTVHATSACPDYGSPAVHSTSACPDYGSPADDGSASTYADYGSPAVHSTSTNICTNQHDERCFFRNQHDQRCFFRNRDCACLVTHLQPTGVPHGINKLFICVGQLINADASTWFKIKEMVASASFLGTVAGLDPRSLSAEAKEALSGVVNDPDCEPDQISRPSTSQYIAAITLARWAHRLYAEIQ